jgi:hypothetical protein
MEGFPWGCLTAIPFCAREHCRQGRGQGWQHAFAILLKKGIQRAPCVLQHPLLLQLAVRVLWGWQGSQQHPSLRLWLWFRLARCVHLPLRQAGCPAGMQSFLSLAHPATPQSRPGGQQSTHMGGLRAGLLCRSAVKHVGVQRTSMIPGVSKKTIW